MAQSDAIAATSDAPNGTLPRRRAVLFIVFLGIVSLFGDMTYEGARSITGPYLGVLGVTATTIGIVAGFGELLGYGARLVSGYLGDRTGKYWAVTIAGYLLNLFAVPLLALAGAWQIAVVLIIAERMGRGIRSPVRDAMLSHAASQTGLGWGFGLHQALDQLGAVAGPLVVSAVLFVGSGYQAAFGWLLIPALLSMTVLLAARYLFPRPHDFELAPPPLEGEGLAPIFWVYIVAVAFIAAGYADFSLIAYHFDKAQIMPTTWIPIPLCGRDDGRRSGRAGFGLIVRPDRDLDDGARDDRFRRRGSVRVSRQFSPCRNRNGLLGRRHRRAGFDDARHHLSVSSPAAARNRLRHHECRLRRRLVRRQRPARSIL